MDVVAIQTGIPDPSVFFLKRSKKYIILASLQSLTTDWRIILMVLSLISPFLYYTACSALQMVSLNKEDNVLIYIKTSKA